MALDWIGLDRIGDWGLGIEREEGLGGNRLGGRKRDARERRNKKENCIV